jgi:hypothetical protein
MFINYTKEFVFLAVPKNASTSIQASLIERANRRDILAYTKIPYEKAFNESYNVPEYEIITHWNLNDALLNKVLSTKQIEKFNIFGVIRNPVERFVSLTRMRFPDTDINDGVGEYLRIRHDDYLFKRLGKPQLNWLRHDNKLIKNIILYDNLNEKISNLPRHRSYNSNKTESLSQCLRKEIINMYEEDYELYRYLAEKNNDHSDNNYSTTKYFD